MWEATVTDYNTIDIDDGALLYTRKEKEFWDDFVFRVSENILQHIPIPADVNAPYLIVLFKPDPAPSDPE